MSNPHPNAAGSYGAAAVKWAADAWKIELRWWQRLALARLLEHDDTGALVWVDSITTTARQVGKSVLLRVLAGWRQHTTVPTLPQPCVIMHTGRDLAVCRNIQRPVRTWARMNGTGYTIKEANGADEVTTPAGARWLIRSQTACYGYTVDLGLVDEGWDVAAVHVAEGIEPTMLERASGHLAIFSTAHRKATDLVLDRRAMALATWDRPDSTLLVEWSAPAVLADLADRDAWRQASPHWTPGRERLLAQKLDRVDSAGEAPALDLSDAAGTFRTQYLNQWPASRLVDSGVSEPLAAIADWLAAADPSRTPDPGPVSIAVEDYYGLGCSAAAAQVGTDGRVFTWGAMYATRADAYRWAEWLASTHPGSVILVGTSLVPATVGDAVRSAEVVTATLTATRSALPLVRELLTAGRLCHAGDVGLAGQVDSVRVTASGAGGLLPARGSARSDLLRATAWAVQHATLPRALAPEFFVY
jgi:hypothetical protein